MPTVATSKKDGEHTPAKSEGDEFWTRTHQKAKAQVEAQQIEN
jgi:hypothetical protein